MPKTQNLPNLQITCSIFTAPNTTGSNHRYNTLELLMVGIMVPETCWGSNKICDKNHLLHLVGILFPHIFVQFEPVWSEENYKCLISNVYRTQNKHTKKTTIHLHICVLTHTNVTGWRGFISRMLLLRQRFHLIIQNLTPICHHQLSAD
jgi:hypothetical protein